MKIKTFRRQVDTDGNTDMHDLTDAVRRAVEEVGVSEGLVTVFVPGATAGVTTLELEPGVVHDFAACFERLAPVAIAYAHEQAWHDGNGHAHVRAGLLGPSLTIPVAEGQPLLGTWQQVVLIDFDNRSRQRSYAITVMGT